MIDQEVKWVPNGGHSDECAYVGGISARCSCSATEPKPAVRAILSQLDPKQRMRGWEIVVLDWVWTPRYREGGTGAWVNSGESTFRTPLQKPGLRPPTMAQRRAALTRLGYEPDDNCQDLYEREWQWQEAEWSEGRPYLFAALQVRPILAEVSA